ncbi:MAG: response regulator [Vulcanimicrobiota bacterium]
MNDTGTILVCEDSEVERAALEGLLARSGHRVIVTGCGSEFLERARQRPPQLAIVDHNLPDMQGIEVVRQLRESRLPRFPVIMITGELRYNHSEEAFEVGVDDYLRKPVSPGEIQARVALHLRHRDNAREAANRERERAITELSKVVITRVQAAKGHPELLTGLLADLEILTQNGHSARRLLDPAEMVDIALRLSLKDRSARRVGKPEANLYLPPSRFLLVLMDLIGNALEVCQEMVTVLVDDYKEGVEIRVEDDGPGFSFGLNYLGDAQYTSKDLGTGLGLIRAREFAEEFHGRLSLANRADQGAVASLWLPSFPKVGLPLS